MNFAQVKYYYTDCEMVLLLFIVMTNVRVEDIHLSRTHMTAKLLCQYLNSNLLLVGPWHFSIGQGGKWPDVSIGKSQVRIIETDV